MTLRQERETVGMSPLVIRFDQSWGNVTIMVMVEAHNKAEALAWAESNVRDQLVWLGRFMDGSEKPVEIDGTIEAELLA